MDTEIQFVELERIQQLTDLLSETVRQFIKTKEELMRTTFQVQIEVLKKRLMRLKISIIEMKSQIDAICVPKEAQIVELAIHDKVRPYSGAEISENESVEEFSWKTKSTLEDEKKTLLRQLGSVCEDAVEKVYDLYTNLSVSLYEQTKKSHVR